MERDGFRQKLESIAANPSSIGEHASDASVTRAVQYLCAAFTSALRRAESERKAEEARERKRKVDEKKRQEEEVARCQQSHAS